MRNRLLTLSIMVGVFMAIYVLPAFAAEPADYAVEATTFVGAMASEAWPIALALFTALIGITLGVAVFRYILGRGKGLVKGR